MLPERRRHAAAHDRHVEQAGSPSAEPRHPSTSGEQIQLQDERAQDGEAERLPVLVQHEVAVASALYAAGGDGLQEGALEEEVVRRQRVPDVSRNLIDRGPLPDLHRGAHALPRAEPTASIGRAEKRARNAPDGFRLGRGSGRTSASRNAHSVRCASWAMVSTIVAMARC